MTRPIARVRFPDGTEGDVLHVSVGGDTMTAYFALVRISTGELLTRRLDGAVEIEPPLRVMGHRDPRDVIAPLRRTDTGEPHR